MIVEVASSVVAVLSVCVIAFHLLVLIRYPQDGKGDRTIIAVLKSVSCGLASTLIMFAIARALYASESFTVHPTLKIAQIFFDLASSASALLTAVICFKILPVPLGVIAKDQMGGEVQFESTKKYMHDVAKIVKDSVLVLDGNLKVVLGNDASKILLGASSITGMTFSDFLHPQDLQSFQDAARLVNTDLNFVPIRTIECRVKVMPSLISPFFKSKKNSSSRGKVYCAPITGSLVSSIGSLLPPIASLATIASVADEFVWVESSIMRLTRINERNEVEFALEIVSRNIDERKLNQKILFDKMLKETEELGRINAAKLRYLSCIAHDLKTPLQSFCYTLDLLLQTNLQTDQREFVEQASVSVDLMRLTISQTMDIGKALTGMKLMPRRSPVILSTIIKKVDLIIQGYSKEVPVTFEVAPLICDEIFTDEEWLWQMLLNLLTNACKYTDRGCITVKVSLAAQRPTHQQGRARGGPSSAEPPQVILFEVIDTGVGVKDSQLRSMFDAFAQVQDGQLTGTGLGLFGVRMRAEGLQGSYGARHNTESSTGTGTITWSAIPYLPNNNRRPSMCAWETTSSLKVEVEEEVTQVPRHSTPDTSTRSVSSNKSDLVRHAQLLFKSRPLSAIIVEDTLVIRKLMKNILLQVGFASVECYENGSKGLAALLASEVDIVFSDVQMPIMSGPEMVSRFREFEAGALASGARTKRQVIVAVTANGPELRDNGGGGGSGFDDVYAKPLSRDNIYAVVTEFAP